MSKIIIFIYKKTKIYIEFLARHVYFFLMETSFLHRSFTPEVGK